MSISSQHLYDQIVTSISAIKDSIAQGITPKNVRNQYKKLEE